VLTLHLIALDHIEHDTGPFSPESVAILEQLDAAIGSVRAAAEHVADGHAYIAVVSDHGFAECDQQLNLFSAFREAKLIAVDDKGKITDWRAIPWVQSAAAAIMLKDPDDMATRDQVRDLLAKLAQNPANGIDRVIDAGGLRKRGGFPTAAFFVSLKVGWKMGASLDGPLFSKVKPGGTHGELPDLPGLRAAFFLVGPGVPADKKLGVIDMRDIAPTLAHRIGLSLPTADGKNLLP
jgi:predicted AlkP superfamily pyrophosphatase or phosphodiesterase